jgi:hypothetical protein
MSKAWVGIGSLQEGGENSVKGQPGELSCIPNLKSRKKNYLIQNWAKDLNSHFSKENI